jgi:oligopeptide transport system permease protein
MNETSRPPIDLSDTGLCDEELFSRIPQDTLSVEKITAPRYSYWRSVGRVFFHKKINIVVLACLALILVFTYIYPSFSGYDKYQNIMDSASKHLTPAAAFKKFGFSIHWLFGTGESGQSTFDGLWYGARISISIALICTLINFTTGILIGAVWGFSKKVDIVLNEIRNVIIVVPGVFVTSVLMLVFSPSFWTLVFSMCITGWIGIAYSIRTQVIIIRDRDYNLASKCLGSSTFRIATKNMLPFLISFIVTMAATSLPGYIGSEAFLSYIGLGISDTTLGKILFNSQIAMVTPGWGWEFWCPVILSAFISVVLFLVGQSLGDAADPRTHML